MEIDKTQLTHDVASAIWKSKDPFDMNGPLEDQDRIIQFNLKMSILPVLTHAVPVAQKAFEDKMRKIISTGLIMGLSADMILLDISAEIGE